MDNQQKKLISNFEQFEMVYERVEFGESIGMDELNEGLFSGIMNFFSKVFGGRVTELDSIISKYKKNEASYWERWTNANHEYNKASVKRETTEDAIDQRKNLEMMERSNKLLRQVTKTRDDVNDALDRQAMMIIRDNRRLRLYWEVKKSKADEEVANTSYSSLKKKVDSDTLDELYDRVRETQKAAKEKIKKMPKGTMTVDFGTYDNLSKEDKEVPFNKFGIHDLSDFVYASDDLWNERVKLMPDANKAAVVAHISDALQTVKDETAKEARKYKGQIDAAEGESKKKLETDLKNATDYAQQDVDMLTKRMEQLTGKIEAHKDKDDKPTSVSTPVKSGPSAIERRISELKPKISKGVGSTDEKLLGHIMADMLALYDRIPVADKDEDKEEDIRMVQLVDYSPDIHKFRQANKVDGNLPDPLVDELYKEFKKEFPK